LIPGSALTVEQYPAFLTRACGEATQTSGNTRSATEGLSRLLDSASMSPTERNAVHLPVTDTSAGSRIEKRAGVFFLINGNRNVHALDDLGQALAPKELA